MKTTIDRAKLAAAVVFATAITTAITIPTSALFAQDPRDEAPNAKPKRPTQPNVYAENPIQLDYERWHSCVMAVTMAADKTGSVAVWIDEVKLCEYENIKTCANTNPSITQITMGGTIAQPAYDAPAHYRQFDALLLTDNWQNIIDLG